MLNRYIFRKELKCFFLTKKEIQDLAAGKLIAIFNVNCYYHCSRGSWYNYFSSVYFYRSYFLFIS